MLDLTMGLHRSCDRVTRRELLRVGSLAALGDFAAGFLERRARGGKPRWQGLSCILIWLQGGISHIDSFDPKPAAPQEIRGEFARDRDQRAGHHRFATRLPKLAQHQDKYSIVRSWNPKNGSHGVADAYMMTGHPFNPALDLSGLRRGGGPRVRRPQVDAARTSSSVMRSTRNSAAVRLVSWVTSLTLSSCRATPRTRISPCATWSCRGASTARGSSIA